MLHRDRCCGINLLRTITRVSQFIGQSHREAAGMRRRDQLRRVRAFPPSRVVAGDIRSFLEDSTLCGDGSLTMLVRALPNH